MHLCADSIRQYSRHCQVINFYLKFFWGQQHSFNCAPSEMLREYEGILTLGKLVPYGVLSQKGFSTLTQGWTIQNFLEHMKFGDGAEDVANLFEKGS